jgi:hypothetical protein
MIHDKRINSHQGNELLSYLQTAPKKLSKYVLEALYK